ncbi:MULTISPECIES: sigma-70 family RNA polymerase sigma factor [unclassified Thalassospira]|uniref:sigma-70 family RNA polymerase sigma factor n=1 Tax=unclassified Thalassospira TaxID=2648997 RepID=UPI001FEEBD03|nr:sigma-70 family RNA polymerase sigma factor [Thalassospira sp. MCCC 1A01428]
MTGKSTSLMLFMRQRPALINYARTIIGNAIHAEDLVQEAWLRFDEASNNRLLEDATGYLYRIVRNLALDSKRSHARECRMTKAGDYDDAIRYLPADAPDPETIALYNDEFTRMKAALAELPERTRIACEMHRFGGAKLREIATYLNISVPLAHKLIAEGVAHCRERLEWP